MSLASERGDLTGRKSMVSNVLGSWGAQTVFIVAGFILPRMIDRHLGQDVLGVWDFGWSVVSYFDLVSMGLVGSVNRFVAKNRAADDVAGVNRCVSSAFCLLAIVGLVVVGLAVAAARVVPALATSKVGNHVADIKWVILFLGWASAAQTVSYTFAGVLTGCHRWKVHNAITAGGYAVAVVGMIAALVFGGTIKTLALIYFIGEVLRALLRIIFAYRICPRLSVRLSLADWPTARSMMNFGGKTAVPQVAELLLNQTVSVLVVSYLGAAALAIYSRPRSLVLQMRTLVFKMAAVLTPSVSSIQALGNHAEIGELVIKATRYAVFLTLPLTFGFVIFGGPLMRLWMGPRYENDALIAILALGYAGFIIQSPAISILAGLNLHGRPGLANLGASLITAGAVALVVGPLKLGLAWVAVAATLPLAVTFAVYIPWHTCQQINIPLLHYVKEVVVKPLKMLAPFVLWLVAMRFAFWRAPLAGLAVAVVGGGAIMAVLYWRGVLPGSMKETIRKRLHKKPGKNGKHEELLVP